VLGSGGMFREKFDQRSACRKFRWSRSIPRRSTRSPCRR
jgi:hypothetical protein